MVEGDARRSAAVDFGTVNANPRERFAARLLKISTGVGARQMLKLMEALEDHDDVQKVSANFDMDEADMAGA